MKRVEKVALLHKILSGETGELKQLRAQMGRPYTEEERTKQKAYMDSWGDKRHTDQEVIAFFGRYDKASVPGETHYLLPNGMRLSF